MQPQFATRDRVKRLLEQVNITTSFAKALYEAEPDPKTKAHIDVFYYSPLLQLADRLTTAIDDQIFPNKY